MVPSPPRARLIGAHGQLLLAFAFVWAVLALYAKTKRDFTIAGVTLEKTEIGDLLSPPPEHGPVRLPRRPRVAAQPGARPGTVVPAGAASSDATPLPPLDETPQRILIFGDSMVVNLIPPLADYCLENGHKLFPVIWYASTTIAWAAQSKLTDVLREFTPTYVIVVLGSSELGVRNVNKRASSVRQIVERIGNRHFFWLGPPNWRKDTGFNEMVRRTLEKVAGPGHFFRSAEFDLDRESDGIHPTPKAGRKWADQLARWMATEAAVRIPMNEPTKKATPPSAKVYPPPYSVKEHYLEQMRKKREKP
jgi:hypothetical protein